jgi:Mg-chelatase subunit ChlD
VYVFGDGAVTRMLRLPAAIEGPTVTDVAIDEVGRTFAVQGDRIVAWGATGDYIGALDWQGAAWLTSGPVDGLTVSVNVPDGFTGLSGIDDRSALRGPVSRWGDIGTGLGALSYPGRIAASDADVFIVDRIDDGERVQRWSAQGQPLEQWQGSSFSDVAALESEPCYVRGPDVECLSRGGGTRWTASFGSLSWLTALASSGDGSLAALDLAEQTVAVLDADGAHRTSWRLRPSGGYAAVTDIALDAGTLYIADRHAGAVDLRGLDGADLGTIAIQDGLRRLDAADGWLYALSETGWIWKVNDKGQTRSVWQPIEGRLPSDIAVGQRGRVYVADPGLDGDDGRILVYEPGGPAPTAPDPLPQDRCEIKTDKSARPGRVYPGEKVTVTLRAAGSCPPAEGRLDIALIIDRSASMGEGALTAAQSAAISFVNELDTTASQIAIVAFSDAAEVRQPLTPDFQLAVQGIVGLEPEGQTRFTPALDLALGELTGPSSRADAPRVAILLTDGYPSDVDTVQAAADRLKGAGVTLHIIGLGSEVDSSMLQAMASSPAHFHRAPTEAKLADIYGDIARLVSIPDLLRSATLTDLLPQDMRYARLSARPPARSDGQVLIWDVSSVQATGLEITYVIRPQVPGIRPTNLRAVIDYVDSSGYHGTAEFPVPTIEVLPRIRWDLYLPVLWRHQCRPQRADVVLVFDTSSSMTEPSGIAPGELKLDAALDAGRAFLDAMQLPGDQAAVITFNEQAHLVRPLTGSRQSLESALASVQPGEGTRIDLGLQLATVELIGPRAIYGNNPVVVLLTDGRPTAGFEEATRVEARTARDLGITVFAIGLGGNADMELLRILAGDSERSFFAPDAEALESIYWTIAGQVLCD